MEFKKESILVSSIRSLCNTLGGLIGILVGAVIIFIALIMFSKAQQYSDKTQLVIAADANGSRELLPSSAPVVLKINIHGPIGTKMLNTRTIEAQLLDSRAQMLKNDRVKALLLHINSPGGTATDSYSIYTALKNYKEKYNIPIYAYVDGICASGAMMIACSADKILASPPSIIGSVGVIMGPNFNISSLMEKYGVKQLTFSKGKDKDTLSPFKTWKENEGSYIKNIINYQYDLFVNIVTSSRPDMNKEKLVSDYGAQVFDPAVALNYGYIDDKSGSYSQTLTELTKKANLDTKYQVVELKIIQPVFADLIEGRSNIISGKIKHELSLNQSFPSEFINKPLYYYHLGNID